MTMLDAMGALSPLWTVLVFLWLLVVVGVVLAGLLRREE